MLVFESEIVPNEPPEHFKWRKDGEYEVGVDIAHLYQRHRQRPSKAENQILDNGEVVPLERDEKAHEIIPSPCRHQPNDNGCVIEKAAMDALAESTFVKAINLLSALKIFQSGFVAIFCSSLLIADLNAYEMEWKSNQ